MNYNLTSYYRKGVYTTPRWTALVGPYPLFFQLYLEGKVGYAIDPFVNLIDPVENQEIGVQHMFAVMSGYYGHLKDNVKITDVTGWAGDLMSVAKNVVKYRDNSRYEGDLLERTYAAAFDLIGMKENEPFDDLLFSLDDLLGDVDAYNIVHEAKAKNASVAEFFPSYYTLGQANTRFTRFFNNRFNGDRAKLLTDVVEVMKGDFEYAVARDGLIGELNLSEGELEAIAVAFYNKLLTLVDQGK